MPISTKRKRKHVPNGDTRKLVQSLSALGVRYEDIALKLDISHDTLTRHYRRELDLGRIDANAAVANTLYSQARAGNITASIFWMKTRAGWREKSDLNVVSEDNSMSPPTTIRIVAAEDLLALAGKGDKNGEDDES